MKWKTNVNGWRIRDHINVVRDQWDCDPMWRGSMAMEKRNNVNGWGIRDHTNVMRDPWDFEPMWREINGAMNQCGGGLMAMDGDQGPFQYGEGSMGCEPMWQGINGNGWGIT